MYTQKYLCFFFLFSSSADVTTHYVYVDSIREMRELVFYIKNKFTLEEKDFFILPYFSDNLVKHWFTEHEK
jgi:hypothetical protein